MVRKSYTPEQIINKLREAETLFSRSIVVSGGVRLSPVSTRNTDEPLRGSFKIRISDSSREAATWKMGLKGGFGFMATIDLVCLAST